MLTAELVIKRLFTFFTSFVKYHVTHDSAFLVSLSVMGTELPSDSSCCRRLIPQLHEGFPWLPDLCVMLRGLAAK